MGLYDDIEDKEADCFDRYKADMRRIDIQLDRLRKRQVAAKEASELIAYSGNRVRLELGSVHGFGRPMPGTHVPDMLEDADTIAGHLMNGFEGLSDGLAQQKAKLVQARDERMEAHSSELQGLRELRELRAAALR